MEHRRSHGKQGGVHAVFITSVGVAWHVGRQAWLGESNARKGANCIGRIRSAVSVLVARYRLFAVESDIMPVAQVS